MTETRSWYIVQSIPTVPEWPKAIEHTNSHSISANAPKTTATAISVAFPNGRAAAFLFPART